MVTRQENIAEQIEVFKGSLFFSSLLEVTCMLTSLNVCCCLAGILIVIGIGVALGVALGVFILFALILCHRR